MRVQPRSEQELNTLNLMDEGTYDCEVVEFHDTDKYNKPMVSKTGNPMSMVKLKVWDMSGLIHTVFDYLVETDRMAFKSRHFCEALGILDKYENGEFVALDVLGKTCKVIIGVQVGQPKPEGGSYPNKNVVKDYVKPLALVKSGLPTETFNDDIKF